MTALTPRPYQIEAKRAVYRAFKSGARSVLVVAATGLGKGMLVGTIAGDAVASGKRVLVFVHRKEIVDQLAGHVREWAGIEPAIERAEQREATDASKVVVASIASLVTRLDRFPSNRFDLLIYDECFPAGTRVDGRLIETLRMGDVVSSIDHASGTVVSGRITRLFCSRPTALVMLHLRNGKTIVCTPGHPFYVPGIGYQQAHALIGLPVVRRIVSAESTQVLLGRLQDHRSGGPAASRNPSMPGLRCERPTLRSEALSGTQRARLLLVALPGPSDECHVVRPDGRDQSTVRVRTDDEPEPDVACGHPGEGLPDSQTKRPQASCPGRQWASANPGRTGDVRCYRMAYASDCQDKATAGFGVSLPLQNRCGHGRTSDRSGDRRPQPLDPGAQGPGRKEGGFLEVDWVDRIQVLQPGSDGRFGGLCPDGLVYNIEVEGTHNYFANGVLVHNCHHAVSEIGMRALDHFASARVVGLTATPNRGDERALGQVFQEVAFDMPLPEAIRQGWLVPIRTVKINLPSLDLSGVRRRHGDLVAGELGAVMSEVKVLREAAVEAIRHATDKQALLFAVTRAHMHAAVEAIRQVAEERRVDLPIATIDGDTPTSERDQIVADFRSGKIRWLANVGVATEGFDAPGVEVVIDLQPTESRALRTQKIGRGTRPLAGIVDGVTAADMSVRIDHLMATGQLQPGNPWVDLAVLDVYRGDDAAARRLAIAMSAKPECIVLDFAGNSGKHDLASDMDALGGDYSEPERREAQEMIARGDARHLLEALERARAERQARLREAQARAGDPFALFDVPFRQETYGRKPTAKHRGVLDPLRLPLGEIGWRQVNDLCNELARREREDLSLYEQARLLARLGCPVARLPGMTRREASDLIAEIARGGWRRPSWSGMAPTAK